MDKETLEEYFAQAIKNREELRKIDKELDMLCDPYLFDRGIHISGTKIMKVIETLQREYKVNKDFSDKNEEVYFYIQYGDVKYRIFGLVSKNEG